MCHGYGMRWWQAEEAAKKRTEDGKANAEAPPAAGKTEKAEAAVRAKTKEKELVPAE